MMRGLLGEQQEFVQSKQSQHEQQASLDACGTHMCDPTFASNCKPDPVAKTLPTCHCRGRHGSTSPGSKTDRACSLSSNSHAAR